MSMEQARYRRGASSTDDASVQLRAARADPMLMADQMRRAWEDFLAAELRAGPLLLVLEDLQWGDLPSVQFIDGALRALRVGSTQSKRSTPASTAARMSAGVPTPIR